MTPPDTTGAIGPSNYVEIVNSELAAYTRSLTPAAPPVDFSTFTGGVAVCDPQIKYDPHTSRWFYVAIRCDNTLIANTLYVGFSKTSSATPLDGSGWCGYSYSFGTALPDYPKLGLDGTHIMIGDNLFDTVTLNFLSAQITGLAEPPAGTISSCPAAPAGLMFGSSGSPLTTSVGHVASTPEPATVADSSTGGYIVAADHAGDPFIGNGSTIMLWQMGGSGGSPTLGTLSAPAVPAYAVPPDIPQPGSKDAIDSLDARLTNAIAAVDPGARSETIWTEHTISTSSGSLVRWYEIVPGSSPSVRQVGSITDPGGWAFNGAIAPTSSGGAVMDYNTGGPGRLVSVLAQSRIASAPSGTMNSPVALATSNAVDSDFSCPSVAFNTPSCRWGDYSGASVDPTNGAQIWGSNQVNRPGTPANDAQWATQNFVLTANDLAPTASFTVSPAHAVTGLQMSFNAGASKDPDGTVTSYSWKFGDGSTGSGVSPKHRYKKKRKYSVTLTVTDNGGVRTSTTRSIKVNRARIIKVQTSRRDHGAVVLKVTVNAPGVI